MSASEACGSELLRMAQALGSSGEHLSLPFNRTTVDAWVKGLVAEDATLTGLLDVVKVRLRFRPLAAHKAKSSRRPGRDQVCWSCTRT